MEELAKVTGKTVTAVKDMVSNKQISFEMVEQAMQNLTSEGGRFANMMEAQSQSLSGQWAQFTDTLAAMGEKIGMSLVPIFKELLKVLNLVVE